MKMLAFVICLIALVVGLIGLVAPTVLVTLAQVSIAPSAFLAAGLVRLLFGALLIAVATATRMPRLVRIAGCVVVVMGTVTVLMWAFAMAQANAMVEQWTMAGDGVIRLSGVVLVVLAALLAYALAPGTRRAKA
ncbi:hypothetical protein [Dyella sp. ASV21]|uniref:hypothetical protein n=1 Tax=Dyella sp. ASV21 TaxID=2795114 RepID=UPI0018EA3C44|nr:hypothetical protein [Dyella sp. ASV21]